MDLPTRSGTDQGNVHHRLDRRTLVQLRLRDHPTDAPFSFLL